MPAYVWTFAAFTVPFVATPGASTVVVLRNSIAGGIRSGVATAVGVNLSSVCYGLLTAFGVSAALQRWPSAWTVLRIGGTAYLALLGLRSLARAWTHRQRDLRLDDASVNEAPLAQSAGEGFTTNMLNPSIAIFYLFVLPQFIPRDAPFVRVALILTSLHVALALTWHLTWAGAGGTLAQTLGRSGPRRALEAVSGAALLALAVKLAL